LLALTGWNCRKAPTETGPPGFHLECVSCFFKVHSQQLLDAHFDIAAGDKSYSFVFDPLSSHLKHCFFNHSVA